MMVVSVSPGGEVLRPSRPKELFRLDDDSRISLYGDEAPDGRFLMVREGEGATITLVFNWFEEYEAKTGDARE